MYVLIEPRESVAASYRSGFDREGVASVSFEPADFIAWLQSASNADLLAVHAFLLGDSKERTILPAVIRKYSEEPIIALRDLRSLAHTIELFEAGVDDVLHVPVHIREILVRTAAIRRRRIGGKPGQVSGGVFKVFFDGRNPQIDGKSLELPRRELRILEYMATHQNRWITKTQVFNAIYGVFDCAFDECVIESHISKLRKKLRARLGYDPILSKRFVGYYFDASVRAGAAIDNDKVDETGETTLTGNNDRYLPGSNEPPSVYLMTAAE
jgi:two-component system, OmpR family, flagellar system response regulator FtcR